jgi:hypothetical protein
VFIPTLQKQSLKINTGDGIEQIVKDSYEPYFFLRAGNICCEITYLISAVANSDLSREGNR